MLILDLFDLAQCAASVLVTVREGRRAGFGGPAAPKYGPWAALSPSGIRTRGLRDHSPALALLSFSHHGRSGSVQPQDIEDRVSQDMQDSQLTSPAWQPG